MTLEQKNTGSGKGILSDSSSMKKMRNQTVTTPIKY